MLNLGQLTYDSVSRHLETVISYVYNETRQEAKLDKLNYVKFYTIKKWPFVFSNIMFAILNHPEIVDSVQFSIPIVKKMRKIMCYLFRLNIEMYNNAIIHRGKHNLLISLFNEISIKFDSSLKDLKLLSTRLVSGSNVLGRYFIIMAASVSGIIFCGGRMRYLLNRGLWGDYRYKNKTNNEEDYRALVDYVWNISNEYVKYCIKKLECYCVKTTEEYHKFLLEDLEKVYGCGFEELLLCIANAYIASGDKIFPMNELFICDGRPMLFRSLTENKEQSVSCKRKRSSSDLENDSYAAYKKVCSSKVGEDISGNGVQQLCNQDVFPSVGEIGSGISQGIRVAGPSNSGVIQQSYNNVISCKRKNDCDLQNDDYTAYKKVCSSKVGEDIPGNTVQQLCNQGVFFSVGGIDSGINQNVCVAGSSNSNITL
ncbi:hypothetical protein K6025_05090 [Ehrlichia sp. JZT12]